MNRLARFIAFAAMTLSVTGCGNPVTERRYITEGAGVDLYTADRANQAALLQEYMSFICEGEGIGPTCDGNWTLFVQAGMNDIDLRCDGFLTWIDARRRDKEPVLAEISAVTAAVHTIMTVTGSSPKSLDILTAAFGLASATYTNWNTRLLIAVDQSTIQEIVYNGQGQFRAGIKAYQVPDQPAAIYLLRNYLRICLPTTIEASINITTSLVQRGSLTAAQTNLVVRNTVPAIATNASPRGQRFVSLPDDATAFLETYLAPGPNQADHRKVVMDFLMKEVPTLIEQSGPAAITVFKRAGMYATQRKKLVDQLKNS